mmetsp:Transcript_6190/g.15464  ORF Transcript_6190/g.15464 Transcript_6190/m.15464 type:complete len:89 (+) Transcript_6190:952-1218(+)
MAAATPKATIPYLTPDVEDSLALLRCQGEQSYAGSSGGSDERCGREVRGRALRGGEGRSCGRGRHRTSPIEVPLIIRKRDLVSSLQLS